MQLEITLERYRVFYEFKKYVYSLSMQEVRTHLFFMDELPPKEQGLALVLLYMYEQAKSPEFYAGHKDNSRLFDVSPRLKEIPAFAWGEIGLTLTQYEKANNTAIAFPAIEMQGDLKEIEKEYRHSRSEAGEKARKLQAEFEVFGYNNMWDGNLYGPHIPWRDTMPPSFREKYVLELDEIEVLREFSHGLSGRPLILHSYSHLTGNSSEKPKTVGEIAAQLRRARERYLAIAKENQERFSLNNNTHK